MPSKTPKQARAMAAACYGKSNLSARSAAGGRYAAPGAYGTGKLGIPKKVACEFAAHDQAKKSPRYKKAHGL